jgi:hypothetical protein
MFVQVRDIYGFFFFFFFFGQRLVCGWLLRNVGDFEKWKMLKILLVHNKCITIVPYGSALVVHYECMYLSL